MKILFLLLAVLNSNWALATSPVLVDLDYACRNTEVIIDSIIKNDSINGHVKGLPTNSFKKFKMVFYVKTNRWYVHPYSSGGTDGDGYSFTYLNADGTFKIKTLRRDVPASKLAAVLVPRSYKIYPQHFRLHPLFGRFGGVTKGACSYTTRIGNGDFFL